MKNQEVLLLNVECLTACTTCACACCDGHRFVSHSIKNIALVCTVTGSTCTVRTYATKICTSVFFHNRSEDDWFSIHNVFIVCVDCTHTMILVDFTKFFVRVLRTSTVYGHLRFLHSICMRSVFRLNSRSCIFPYNKSNAHTYRLMWNQLLVPVHKWRTKHLCKLYT